ncbi:MAG: hypothetical protein WEB51_07100, partial [Mycobacterium sp.]
IAVGGPAPGCGTSERPEFRRDIVHPFRSVDRPGCNLTAGQRPQRWAADPGPAVGGFARSGGAGS